MDEPLIALIVAALVSPMFAVGFAKHMALDPSLKLLSVLSGNSLSRFCLSPFSIGRWLILRVVTIGRYPPQQSQPHSREFVAMAAFVVFLVGITVYFTGRA